MEKLKLNNKANILHAACILFGHNEIGKEKFVEIVARTADKISDPICGEQQPAGQGGKEEEIINRAAKALEDEMYGNLANELKSLRPQPKQEWSEEEMKDIQEASDYLRDYANNYVQGGNSKLYVQSLADRIESLRPQPKEEREPMEIIYGGKIYQVHGMRALPGGATGYIIEDEPGHYDCIMNPEEVLGGGYGVKQNGSPYPTKEATFDESHWKPSEEQMKSLAQAVGTFASFEHLKDDSKVLTSLYNDLKKL